MKAVLDTNILIDFLNGHEQASQELSQYEERIISIITYIEILVGAKNEAQAQRLRAFLKNFTIRELSNEVANISIDLRKRYRMKIPDAVVYATARNEGCILVSRNIKDFKSDCPDIRVPYKI